MHIYTDLYCQFPDPQTDVKYQFLDQNNLDAETVIMNQFLGPKTDKKINVSGCKKLTFFSVYFLDPETDTMDQFLGPM